MKLDFTEGRIFLKDGEWYLDAEPHVLVLFERLFPSSKIVYGYYLKGKIELQFTQRARVISDTTNNRKDLNWFVKRYNLKISSEDRDRLKMGDMKYDNIQKESKNIMFNYKPLDLKLALPLRKYQEQAVSLALHKESLLIADQVGLGKTPIAIAIAAKNLPAVCIVPPHIVSQWEYEIHKFLPKAKVFKVRSWKDIESLPPADFYVDSYTRVYKGTDHFVKIKPKTLIVDEVHSLRRDTTKKYESVKTIATQCRYRIGLSATPIMNYGNELFNIYEILEEGCLGDSGSFNREWCDWEKIRDPELLGNFLRKHFLMIRRTRKDVDLEIGEVNRIIYNVDADMDTLREFDKEAKVLAMKIITGEFTESGGAAREFDYKLRQATGLAKARAVAQVVKMVVDSGENVVLFGWHRDVYTIWLKELEDLGVVMYTGSETTKEKEESLKQFVEGKAKVIIISLRSGAGINGLQEVSSYAIFGELDWSAGIIDQCIGRLWRDGQKDKVTAMFVTIEDGADPIMKKVIGNKAMEAKKILNPEAEVLANTGDKNKILGLAKEWLKNKGVDVDTIIKKKEKENKGELHIAAPKEGEQGYQIWDLLTKQILSTNDETNLQEEIESIFVKQGIEFKREFALSKNSRVDFKIGKILVECKAGKFNKRDMLRQIKKYKRDYQEAQAIIVVTPNYMKHFQLKGFPVYVVNTANTSLLIEGLS